MAVYRWFADQALHGKRVVFGSCGQTSTGGDNVVTVLSSPNAAGGPWSCVGCEAGVGSGCGGKQDAGKKSRLFSGLQAPADPCSLLPPFIVRSGNDDGCGDGTQAFSMTVTAQGGTHYFIAVVRSALDAVAEPCCILACCCACCCRWLLTNLEPLPCTRRRRRLSPPRPSPSACWRPSRARPRPTRCPHPAQLRARPLRPVAHGSTPSPCPRCPSPATPSACAGEAPWKGRGVQVAGGPGGAQR